MYTIVYDADKYVWNVISNFTDHVVFTGSLGEAQLFVYDNDPSAR